MQSYLLLIVFVAGFILAFLWEFITARILKIDHLACQKGYHFHHSLFGLVCFVLCVYYLGQLNYEAAARVFVFGMGIIVQHSLTKDGLVFLTKD